MAQQKGGSGRDTAAAAAGSSAAPAGAGSGGSSGLWGLRYIMELLTSFLLNRLQLSITNVHAYLKVRSQLGFSGAAARL